ncbi:MAG: 2-oxoacid:acceptor oxidoreductase subunit alpha [Myxococcota bacterium]
MSEAVSSANNGNHSSKPIASLDSVVIRFAGDSGDGMQLTGTRFTSEAASVGNDLRTFPDFPAEIRAPAGTLAGVSAFQLHFADQNIYTPGDSLDVLVAMNPAALKVNLGDLKKNGVLIINPSQFGKRNLEKAGYAANPLEDHSLEGFKVYQVDITKMTTEALDDMGLNSRTVDRCKNFFALGLLFWMYSRKLDNTIAWLEAKFAKKPELAEANIRVLKAGYYYGETAEIFEGQYDVKPAALAPGVYRNIAGNTALSLGFVAAAQKAHRPLFLGSYPITPASDILHELSAFKNFSVYTFQAEDEIAAVTSAIGAAFGGALALTTTSGPGVALKGEAIGLAIMTELPLVVVDVQRGGPSTGLPTKTEQADLLQALYGRNSEAPMPVLAASTPSECFDIAFEASRIALKYMTPVMVLTDGYLANGAEPWRVPSVESLPEIHSHEVTEHIPGDVFQPYIRDPETLARPWARLGTPGLEHRIGGLEKAHITGGVSYDPENHEFMCRLRAEKVRRIQQEIGPTKFLGDDSGDLLVVGWGSTRGAIQAATENLRAKGKKVSAIHLRYLNPLPADLGDIFKRFNHIVCPEMNLGQLSRVLRAEYLVDVKSISKVQGKPFGQQELVRRLNEILEGKNTGPFLIKTLEYMQEPQADSVFSRFQ